MTESIRPPRGPCFADLRGKSALVTGGGAGIGRGITRRLVEEGMQVFICGRTESKLNEEAERARKLGGSVIPVVADVGNEDAVEAVFERIRQDAGHLDVLVHNAALVAHRPMAEMDTEFWRKMIATNLDSSYYLAKRSAEMMVARGCGSMILISTIGSFRAHRGMPAYDCSKAAVGSLVRSLAIEFGSSGVRANGIAPGPIAGQESSVRPGSPSEQRNSMALDDELPLSMLEQKHVPLGRMGLPAEIAAAVAFLASEQSSYMTGHTLIVDGGTLAQLVPRNIWI